MAQAEPGGNALGGPIRTRRAVEQQSSGWAHQVRPFRGYSRRVTLAAKIWMRPDTGVSSAGIGDRRVTDRNDLVPVRGHDPRSQATIKQVVPLVSTPVARVSRPQLARITAVGSHQVRGGAEAHPRLDHIARAGARREADRRTKRVLQHHAQTFQLRWRSGAISTWYGAALDLAVQNACNFRRNLFGDARAHTVSCAGNDQLGTCF